MSDRILSPRGTDNLDDIIFALAVNFLLYVVLIIVFYLLVRFYLEEETGPSEKILQKLKDGYSLVSTNEVSDIELPSTSIESDDVGEIENSMDNKKLLHTSSFLNMNVPVTHEGTQQEIILKVVLCAVGLNVSFGIWGLLQERILTQTYDGDFFEYSYGLVFINRLFGLILSAFLMYHYKITWVSSPLWEYSIPSVANMLSSWCQYEALKYVSFPTQMLAKAFKMLPVMLMGKFIHNKSYESYEYIAASGVGFGLYIFLNSAENIDFKQNVFGDPESIKGAWCGVALLFLFLFFDSFTGQWQTRMFQIYGEMSPLQMMLIMNAFSMIFSFVTLVHQEELDKSLYFVYSHSEIYLHLFIFCLCSTIGQLFIFYTVKNFGALVFSIIMSIRILSSTLLSCFVYSHPISELGFVGILIVFGSISYRIQRKTDGKPLLKWRDYQSNQQVMHEWHEHLDI